MKHIHYKDFLVYLILSSFLVLIGACFTSSVLVFNGIELELKFLSLCLIVLNSVLIYSYTYRITHPLNAFLLSLLYVVSPTHLDVFVFQFQFQSLISESFLVAALLLVDKKRHWFSVVLIWLAIIFNTKLLPGLLVLSLFKKLNPLQRFLSLVLLLIILIYLSPLFFKQWYFLINQFKTIFYMFENFLMPYSVGILNYSVVVTNYYRPLYFVIIILLAIGYYLYFLKEKKMSSKLIMIFLLISFFGSFVPFKQVLETDQFYYFYLPSMYPGVLFSLLIVFIDFLKNNNVSKIVKVSLSMIVILSWSSSSLLSQINMRDVKNEWSSSMDLLPENFNYEREIKISYARMLIRNNDFDLAEKVIDKGKIKFPETRWYKMLLEIANAQKNADKIHKVFYELEENQIPFDND